jgi:hypothetical protein
MSDARGLVLLILRAKRYNRVYGSVDAQRRLIEERHRALLNAESSTRSEQEVVEADRLSFEVHQLD